MIRCTVRIRLDFCDVFWRYVVVVALWFSSVCSLFGLGFDLKLGPMGPFKVDFICNNVNNKIHKISKIKLSNSKQ